MGPASGNTLATAAPRLAALPRVVHEMEIAGRRWHLEAVADQSALTAVADDCDAFPFGLLLWEAAPVLAGVLADRAATLAGRHVLELGCGVGLAGLVAGGAGARVTQTDHAAEALLLARANAERNGVDGIVQALADWTDWRERRRFDLVIGSDILYEAGLHAALLAILERNLQPGGRVLLTDPGRTTTPAFLARMEQAGWHVERRSREVPAVTPVRAGETVAVTIIEAWRTG
jgi:predicted nicotinamide N-methyase